MIDLVLGIPMIKKIIICLQIICIFKFLLAEMKSRGTEYIKINIERMLYMMYTVEYIRIRT